MRAPSLFVAIAVVSVGQTPLAIAPKIGLIDVYGLRKVPAAKVMQALGVREGDPLPPSKGDAEERLNAVEGIVESHLEAVCCEEGRMILYVGIEERGVTHFDLREWPENEVVLPEEISGTYRRLMEAIASAARRGSTGEDLTRGYSRMADPAARAVQDMLPALADQNLNILRQVLRNSNDETHRAAAVYILGYAKDKRAVINDLQYGLRDPDSGVRGNAAHGLVAMAVYERLHPDPQLKVSATWFIEMLNSLSWADRNKAVWALQTLTDGRDPAVLDQLRERALGSLTEMARWKAPAHAIGAYLLLGRIAGLPDQQVQDAWARGDRETVIAAASKKK
jgi:hypothetical protein